MPHLSQSEPTIPTLKSEIDALRKELRDLQRRTVPEPENRLHEDKVTYSHPSSPSIGVVSPPYRYRRPVGYLTSASINVGTPSNQGPANMRVFKKPIGSKTVTELASVSLIAEDDYELADDLMAEVEELDRIFVVFDTIPDGLADVTVVLFFNETVE